MKCFTESLKESLAQDPKIQFRWEGEWGFKALPYISFTLFGPRVSLNDLALIRVRINTDQARVSLLELSLFQKLNRCNNHFLY